MKKRFNTTGVCVPKKQYMFNVKNKKFKVINMLLSSVVMVFLLSGCSFNSDNGVETTIDVKVIENDIDNNQIMVSGIDNSSMSIVGDKCVISCQDIKIFNKSGEDIIQGDIEVGDIVTVMYDGTIQESYPTKITNVKWIQINE